MNKDTLVVGITGQARSGKDSLTKILIDLMQATPLTGQRVAFADPLKAMYVAMQRFFTKPNNVSAGEWLDRVKMMLHRAMLNPTQIEDAIAFLTGKLDWSETVRLTEYAEDTETKAIHRRNLIDIGSYFRSVDPNFWVNIGISQIGELTDIALVADLRFDNEALACDYVVRVTRPGCDLIYNKSTQSVDKSEQFALIGRYDWNVSNNGSVADLVYEAKDLLDELIVRRVIKMHSGSGN